MNRLILTLLLIITLAFKSFSQSYTIPSDVKRIVFLGNSITYGGKYIEFIDAYFTLHYPNKQYEFINVGLSSETVSGLSEPNHAEGRFPRPDLHERFKRVMEQTKPDLVFACYGMNDGIYMPFSDKRFNKYKKGMYWLHKSVEKTGAKIIHVTPPIYDPRKGEAYANVLDIYSDWLISKRFTDNWQVIDIHWPMKKELEDYRLQDSTFVFAKDGVHPAELGHLFMAEQILLSLGESDFNTANDLKEFILAQPNGAEILKLIQQRQNISKDAWLTFIGHKRPNMKQGLPMPEAQQKLKEINDKIKELLR